MHDLAQSVLGYIRKQNLICPGHRVGIALSGGADSVALLRIMLELKHELGIVLSVVHLNHQLRGAESVVDEQFVRELASSNSLELFSRSCAVRTYAAEEKLSLEAAARNQRYRFFEKLLLGRMLDRIATAHTLDDQAETVLLKLARGAGTRGLAGIFPMIRIQPEAQSSVVSRRSSAEQPENVQTADLENVGTAAPGCPPERSSGAFADDRRPSIDDALAIIRPLLAIRREHLRDYLTDLHQPWREDSSNRDLRHTRNRIRHGILPRFERHVNPNACQTLAEAAEIARGEEEYWRSEIVRLLPQLCEKKTESLTLDHQRLKTFPIAVRRRLLRTAAESLGLNLEFRHIEEILALNHQGQSTALPNAWTAALANNDLHFREHPELPCAYKYELVVPGKTHVPEARIMFQATLLTNSAQSPSSELLDSRFAQHPLTLRNWNAGERFWPAHTSKPRKIKDLLQDRHITGVEKKLWPVIASGDEIVWLRGFGVHHDCIAKGPEGILIRDSDLRAKTAS